MKLFCANAFTGEDLATVTRRMRLVVDSLSAAGHDAYCPVFDPHKIALQKNNDTKAIFEYAFYNIAASEGMVAIVTSVRKSEGQLLEIGAILAAGKPLYLFLHKTAASQPSHLSTLATKTFVWSSDDELVVQLAGI